jgi:hypothetical protein
MTLSAGIALADIFLEAFAAIPKTLQNKVMDFMMRFRSNPDSAGINYEKIHKCADKHMRSVRIDQNYRAIIHKPDNGNTFILMWVDSHDRAYDWAQRRSLRINPETGSLQVLQTEYIIEPRPVLMEENNQDDDSVAEFVSLENQQPPLFAHLRDREFSKLGIPAELFESVRSLRNETEIDALAKYLPVECTEALIGLVCGFSIEEILQEREALAERAEQVEKAEKVEINTEDFDSALQRADSQRRFALITDDLHLQSILQAPLDKWRVFLHPAQRQLACTSASGPVRVLGGAGTGKTVVAMHRARWLAERIAPDSNAGILFTTFSRNLAYDIRQNLSAICKPEVMERITVINLDLWVWDRLKEYNYLYGLATAGNKEEAWAEALLDCPSDSGFDSDFYREEWERVILPQGINTLEEYLTAARNGRGQPLSRTLRQQVWPVLQAYRDGLDARRVRENDQAYRDLLSFMQNDRGSLSYAHVLIDEAQDMSAQAFKLLRFIVPEGENDLFITGDAHQRIYGGLAVVLGRCGIKIKGRAYRLRVNYRTTEEIRRLSVSLLGGFVMDDFDGGADSLKGYYSLFHGLEPEVRNFPDIEAEKEAVLQFIKDICSGEDELSGICIVLRKNQLVREWQSRLEQAGIKACVIDTGCQDESGFSGVRLCTMHRIKGLEFDHVIMPMMNKGIVPASRVYRASDPAEKLEAEKAERGLLYVAASRARKSLLITSSGEASEFLG